MIRYDRNYFIAAVLLFAIEVIIALFVHDNFVRPYLGDVIVVILIYCFVTSFINRSVIPVALAVFAFSLVIEILQYIHIVDKLGLSKSSIATTVMGTSFEWLDLLAYAAGILIVLIIEKKLLKKV